MQSLSHPPIAADSATAGAILAMHRVGALGLLEGLRQGDLPLLSQAQLLAMLNAVCGLPGLEQLAATCAARFINTFEDRQAVLRPETAAHAALRTSDTLGVAALPLEQLSPPAAQLLLRTALAVVATAHGRKAVSRETVALMARVGEQQAGTFIWDLGNLHELESATSEPFRCLYSACLRDATLRQPAHRRCAPAARLHCASPQPFAALAATAGGCA